MGDHITRAPGPAEISRANALREALQRRSPVLSGPNGNSAGTDTPPEIVVESPEIQRAYLEQLVECTPEALSILDPQLRITRVNGEFSRLFGFTAEQALGRRL